MSGFDITIVLSSLIFVVGIFFTVFKKGRRRLGLIVAVVSFIVTIVAAMQSGQSKAAKAGFKSLADMNLAAKAGVTDPTVFESKKDQIKAKVAADEQAKAAEDKAKEEAAVKAAAQAEAEAKAKQDAADAFYKPPADEIAMMNIVDNAIKTYGSASNDLAKGGVRRDRARDLCSSINSKVSGWTGTITNLTTNGDGLGVLEVRLYDRLLVKTFNNALSDIGNKTLIDPDTQLFKKLSKLKEGDRIKFDAKFVKAPKTTDCFYEASLTMEGAMTDPEFIVRFSDIQLP